MRAIKIFFILFVGIGIGVASVLFYCKGKAYLSAYIKRQIENKGKEYTTIAEKNIMDRLYKFGILI